MTEQQKAAADLYNSLLEIEKQVTKVAEIIGRGDGGREAACVKTKIQEARLWGFELQGAIGNLEE